MKIAGVSGPSRWVGLQSRWQARRMKSHETNMKKPMPALTMRYGRYSSTCPGGEVAPSAAFDAALSLPFELPT